jgi:hypothetical protein
LDLGIQVQRRTFMNIPKGMILLLLAGLLGLSIPAAAEEEVAIKTLKVRDGVYMLVGQGGNIGLFVGQDGTFLIDDQFAPLTPKKGRGWGSAEVFDKHSLSRRSHGGK